MDKSPEFERALIKSLQKIKDFFSIPKVRHHFDFTLSDDFVNVVKPYSRKEFNIELHNGIIHNVPAIGIRFVPDHALTESEILELIKLLKIKFKEYLTFNMLNWQQYSSYSVGEEYTTIFIYYAEFEQDIQPFKKLYCQQIHRKIASNPVILRDKELEKELKNVH